MATPALGRTLTLLTLVLGGQELACGVSITAADGTARLRYLTQLDTSDGVMLLLRAEPLLGVGPGGYVDVSTAHRPP